MLPKMVSMVKASETSVVSEWTQLQNAITNADDGSTIRVSGYDTDKDKTITASSTENSLQIHKSIILDLDGCTIYRGRPNPTENNNCVIYVDTSAILTLIDTVGGGTITGALTGRSVYINQGAVERVAVAEGNYVITESDASRLFSTTDEPMSKVIVNSDQGRFVYFKKKIKDGTISVTPEKPVYDGKTMTPAVTVKMGDTVLDKETFKLSASFKADGPVDIHRKICYSSSNPDIATVDKNGLIKAKRKGKCSVYAYAQNGVYKEVKVTVG